MSDTNLPIQLTSFIGREKESADLQRLLESSRLVSLVGAGGCGKTRLALHLAHKTKDNYPDGVYWVDLSSVADAALVPQTVAKALSISMQPTGALADSFVEALRDKKLLIVLDNCEHLLAASEKLVNYLLQAPNVHLLITSREPLAMEGEALYPVLPLGLPPVDSKNINIQEFDAIRLFVERAQSVLNAFSLTSDNRETVVRICRRLDGIPLAIELASTRLNMLSLQQIEARLDDRFALLTSSYRSIVARHRTLRATIDWSHDLLSNQEQILFRKLSVFSGSCSLDAVEAICVNQDLGREQILDLLSSLVNKSLVIAETLKHELARYRMLETIREYALEKLKDADEADVLRDRHLKYFVWHAERIAPELHGENQKVWLTWMEIEHDNLRAAMSWALENKNIEAGMRIANALSFFWNSHGYVYEGQSWYERLLHMTPVNLSPVVSARSAAYAAMFANILGDTSAAKKHGRKAIELCESAGPDGKPVLAMALIGLAASARGNGELAESLEHLTNAAQLNRELNHKPDLAFTLQLLALNAIDLENYPLAERSLLEGLALAQELKDTIRSAHISNYLGDLYRCEKKYRKALKWYEQSLISFNEAEAKRDVAGVLHNLAYTYLHLGEKDKAESLFRDSLSQQHALGNNQGIAECLTGFSAILLDRGLAAEAACLLAATAIHGRDVILQWPAERREYINTYQQVSAKLSTAKFEEAQAEGRNLSLEQAQEFAIYLLDKTSISSKEVKESHGGLTMREFEIAALIGSGKSNIEIADELVLSKRTVESHVSNIMSKLEYKSRAQIVRWALENRVIRK